MNTKAKIRYFSLTDEMRKEEKLDWFKNTAFKDIPFELITPDKKNNWLNISDNDFEELIPVCSKDVKAGNSEKAIFKLYSLGVVTARDEWVYDFDKNDLEKKVKFFSDFFDNEKTKWKNSNKSKKINDFVDRRIKWTSELENYLKRDTDFSYKSNYCRKALFRPFTKKHTYFSRVITHRPYQNESIFGIETTQENKVISFLGISSSHELSVLVSKLLIDAGLVKQGNGITQCLPLYRYTSQGQRLDNITDWGFKLFQGHYQSKQISKEAIFHYVYGVLHNPAYRQKYEQNLKRDFPRIPLYDDFDFWVAQGKALMEIHLNYEEITHYPLQRKEQALKSGSLNKAKLKADKEQGIITLDEMTSLLGVPSLAWEYKLGNRSALEWILDQYKEKKPKDPTIAEKFNTYQFADYKEEVIDLLQRVCAVSVKTMEIIQLMEAKE
jgi:predicted helicase